MAKMSALQTLKKRRKKKWQAEAAKMRGAKVNLEEIDYKNLSMLGRLLSSQGKLFSRKRSGLPAVAQRKVAEAVKHARFLALLPYVS